MLLAIDIGNSHTVLGIFRKEKLIDHFRVTSNHAVTMDECGILVKQFLRDHRKITGVIICSVVPPLTSVYQDMSRKFLAVDPVLVSCSLPLGIKIVYDDPSKVGADRIANAVAAYQLYGGPAIVVDLGTSTNFDVISDKGEYLGGAIAPGVETSSMHLFQRAAQLFKVSLERPRKAIGSSTEESMRSGIVFGSVGQIDEIVNRVREELKKEHKIKKKPKIVATGGLAELIARESRTIEEVNPTLTLEGLRRIYLQTKKSQKNS
ncbi:MAG: type III pantothenate kinase [Candidatus Zixiibacteriota bacterium]|nr:MAG: type III pantothenate kinase [candidate division Zixibacteria bacterium]